MVNTTTGEIVATTAKEARAKGIDLPKRVSIGKPGEKLELGMELTEEGIMLPVTLPPVVFTLFDAAKAAKLVEEDKDLDSWLFECVQKRFELDYGLQLMLIPVGGGK
ncbi:hypothetical protein ES705_43175 [subsurface metagenome]